MLEQYGKNKRIRQADQILICVLVLIMPAAIRAFSPPVQPTPIINSRYQTLLNKAENPANQNEPRRYRKKQKKTRNEIQCDLKEQLEKLTNLSHGPLPSNGQTSIDREVFQSFNSNIYNAIWSSRTVTDVYKVLFQFVNTARDIIHKSVGPSVVDNSSKTVIKDLHIIGPNIAAAALRRVIDLRPDLNGRIGSDQDVQIAKKLIPSLLQIVAREVVHAESEQIKMRQFQNDEFYSFNNLVMSMNQLVGSSSASDDIVDIGMTHVSNANFMHSLAKVKLLQKKNGRYNDEATLKPLVQKTCLNIKDNNQGVVAFVKRLNPALLSEVLSSLATFGMKDESELLATIGDRLKQGDATGKLNSRQLSLGLWTFASLERPHLGIMKSFSRRLRKANIRHELDSADISKAIWSVGQLMKQIDMIAETEIHSTQNLFTDEDVAAAREDSAIMVFTLCGELLQPKNKNRPDVLKLHSLGMNQITDMLESFVFFEFDSNHAIFEAISEHISNHVLKGRHLPPAILARILRSYQRLHINFDDKILSLIVTHFIEELESNGGKMIDGKSLTIIMRSMTMLSPDHNKSHPYFFKTISNLLHDESYLESLNEFELCNIMWCFAMANQYDKSLIKLLSIRMREEDILSTLTPSSTSRYLWSFTKLVEGNPMDLEMKEILYEMFQSLGGILLSAQLTPVDSSSAMWAMAKSSYSLDMGIFDHLSEVLAVPFMLERATIQQISEATWACGKMHAYEDPLRELTLTGEVTEAPYVSRAEKFASYLATECDKMSTKDISQTLWAMGRLGLFISDDKFSPLISKAIFMAQNEMFNSQELANIIWALSKTDFENEAIISCFTQEICEPWILETTTPQEAANVLYALGKMHIRDKKTFDCMNSVLMGSLDKATPQTIANALWAHDSVNLVPPRQLFDSWAKEKLDIVGIYIDNQQVQVIEENE